MRVSPVVFRFLGAGLGSLVAACAARSSPLMRGTMLLDTTPRPSAALVVFVRDSHPCDGGDPFRIVDDVGRFVGESTPLTKFAVQVLPGHHAFFAWQPHGDMPPELYPGANQVGALGGDFDAGKTYVIDVGTRDDARVGRKCFAYPFLTLHFVDAASSNVSEVLDRAAPYVPDVVAGQAQIDRDRGDVSAHVALGMRKLSQ